MFTESTTGLQNATNNSDGSTSRAIHERTMSEEIRYFTKRISLKRIINIRLGVSIICIFCCYAVKAIIESTSFLHEIVKRRSVQRYFCLNICNFTYFTFLPLCLYFFRLIIWTPYLIDLTVLTNVFRKSINFKKIHSVMII